MSGIDIALWDLKGKALGVPVYELLGGKTNDRLRTYASQIQWDWDTTSQSRVTLEEYAEAARKTVAQGFDCLKVNPIGHDTDGKWMNWKMTGSLTYEQMKTAIDRVAVIREAVGPAVDIMIELHCHTDCNTAVQLAKELEQFRILYLEEPTAPLNWENMKYIAERTSIPLATGERTYTRWGFRPYLENHVVTLIQPDLGNCGGLTEGKKICDMAALYDIGFQCHQCGGPLATAAALHLEATLPNFVIHEHNNQSLLPSNRALCTIDLQPVNGYFEVPADPGLGIDLTEKAYALADRYLVE